MIIINLNFSVFLGELNFSNLDELFKIGYGKIKVLIFFCYNKNSKYELFYNLVFSKQNYVSYPLDYFVTSNLFILNTD